MAREALGAALVIAAIEGRVEAIALLLDVGAPIDARGDLGGTALHLAAWHGRAAASTCCFAAAPTRSRRRPSRRRARRSRGPRTARAGRAAAAARTRGS